MGVLRVGVVSVGDPCRRICPVPEKELPPSVADVPERSASTNARNVGVAAAPVVGPAKCVLAACVANVPTSVPVDVTGPPVTVKIAGNARSTLVTEPPVPAEGEPNIELAFPFGVCPRTQAENSASKKIAESCLFIIEAESERLVTNPDTV